LVDNDIGVVELTTATPLAVDTYRRDRITGSFVLVDDVTNATVAAGMVGRPELVSEGARSGDFGSDRTLGG
jgi:sulfate adenylyltransferase subunit 1 (EFTu-like GTPase family)